MRGGSAIAGIPASKARCTPPSSTLHLITTHAFFRKTSDGGVFLAKSTAKICEVQRRVRRNALFIHAHLELDEYIRGEAAFRTQKTHRFAYHPCESPRIGARTSLTLLTSLSE